MGRIVCFKEKSAPMLSLLALTLLYISQLVYVSNRWLSLTKRLIEDAQLTRIRRAIDWKTITPQRKKKVSFWS